MFSQFDANPPTLAGQAPLPITHAQTWGFHAIASAAPIGMPTEKMQTANAPVFCPQVLVTTATPMRVGDAVLAYDKGLEKLALSEISGCAAGCTAAA